ncbi:hypothetical protein [Streptomyces sp. NPDC056242]|uniref:hypothetical protein n=1 Tax=Streptomyces sp. NPDC056242 TaxID=3345760 RepID=UPI0035DA7DFF
MATATEPRPLADVVEEELLVVDAAFRRAFGQDLATWDPETRALFNDATSEVYTRYAAQAVTTC